LQTDCENQRPHIGEETISVRVTWNCVG